MDAFLNDTKKSYVIITGGTVTNVNFYSTRRMITSLANAAIQRNYTISKIMRLLIQNLFRYLVKQNFVCINSGLINNHRLTESNVPP